MAKLVSSTNIRAKLKTYTHISPVLRNFTRWTSVFSCVKCYLLIANICKERLIIIMFLFYYRFDFSVTASIK
jgi:hypothetical protein